MKARRIAKCQLERVLARVFAGSEAPSLTSNQPDVLYPCCVTTFAVYTPENAGFIHARYPRGPADKPMKLYLGRANKLYIEYILGIQHYEYAYNSLGADGS